MELKPLPGFDWRRVVWGRPDSPRSALCSDCSDAIGADDMHLTMWTGEGWAAQFCTACQSKWWGLEHFDAENDDAFDSDDTEARTS